MIDSIYQILSKLGYSHPLHPTLTHLPIGMVMGALFFALVAWAFRRTSPVQTAKHCSVLALIAVVPTTLLGIMDWQQFYGGALLFPIKLKFFLASVLIVFLVLAVITGFLGKTLSKVTLLLYVLCLFCAIGLGYFGGELVYGGRTSSTGIVDDQVTKGTLIFQQNCSACHFTDKSTAKIGPGLKGLFKAPTLPISRLPASDENFRKQLQNPLGKMPPFGHLSPLEVTDLIVYLKTL